MSGQPLGREGVKILDSHVNEAVRCQPKKETGNRRHESAITAPHPPPPPEFKTSKRSDDSRNWKKKSDDPNRKQVSFSDHLLANAIANEQYRPGERVEHQWECKT